MLSAIKIQNYKSIQKIYIELGRVNLFIGENGSGKSNILEAITLASAAEADKLDNNFLSSRGIRVTSSKLMRSNFNSSNSNKSIEIELNDNDSKVSYLLDNDNQPYSKWSNKRPSLSVEDFQAIMDRGYSENSEYSEESKKLAKFKRIEELLKSLDFHSEKLNKFNTNNIKDFVIYSPENSALRNFYEEGQLEPLGINGAGLLKLLKVINESDPEALIDIKEALNLFGWYKEITIPSTLNKSNDKIEIKDRYIDSIIDQRSANEGFLFVLFYIALIVSKDTPNIFAIDNIDTSLNPKLCTKMMKVICDLSEKYNKQIFLTTHNPAILDGLNIKDEHRKLFVVSRNNKGHTITKNIPNKKEFLSVDGSSIKLSEAFLLGYLGGIPKGFN